MEESTMLAGCHVFDGSGAEMRRDQDVLVTDGRIAGSDIPPFSEIDGTSATVRELEHMAAFGLPPRDALLAATRVPAAWLGIAGK